MSRPFKAYLGKDPYIFVSYAHKDKEIVYEEIKRMYDLGYRIWYDEGITPAKKWSDEIADAIDDCSTFLVFISPEAIKSENVKDEIDYALDEKKKLLAIHIKETTLKKGLKLRLKRIQSIIRYNMNDDYYFEKLIDCLDPSIKRENQSIPEDRIAKVNEKTKKEAEENTRIEKEKQLKLKYEKLRQKAQQKIDEKQWEQAMSLFSNVIEICKEFNYIDGINIAEEMIAKVRENIKKDAEENERIEKEKQLKLQYEELRKEAQKHFDNGCWGEAKYLFNNSKEICQQLRYTEGIKLAEEMIAKVEENIKNDAEKNARIEKIKNLKLEYQNLKKKAEKKFALREWNTALSLFNIL